MTFTFSVPTPSGEIAFQLEPGTAMYFVGANGGGKTRLAVKIESDLGERAYRISAHRALTLNPEVAKISEDAALKSLRYGAAGQHMQLAYREVSRWGGKAATHLLNDYDHLIQALFADQANTSLETHRNARAGRGEAARPTKFERLVEIWNKVLPHRTLLITGDNIRVSITGEGEAYASPEMSDGERAVFYLIGQTLIAPDEAVIVFDEPELHVHRAILGRLWDELEAARTDCAMLAISHDLDFVATREGQKFVIQDYAPARGWSIEVIPENTGFSEAITTLILGSRKPVLFVEGSGSSLDRAIFRACYSGWTIIPRGSCEEVIHAVVTMRANATLTRVSCSGIVDADDYAPDEASFLASKGIQILPVSEIENLFLLPDVVEAILRQEGFEGAELEARREQVLTELFEHAQDDKNLLASVLGYARRRIDRTLKKIDLSDADDAVTLAAEYTARTSGLDVSALTAEADERIRKASNERDAPELLRWYDNKGLMAISAKAKNTIKPLFEQWIVRSLRNGTAPLLSAALAQHLPAITPA